MNKTRAHWGFVYKTVTDLAYAPDSQISFSSRKKNNIINFLLKREGSSFLIHYFISRTSFPGEGGGQKNFKEVPVHGHQFQ